MLSEASSMLGSVLPGKFRFAYEKVKQDVKIVSTRSKAKAGSRENSSPASPQEEV